MKISPNTGSPRLRLWTLALFGALAIASASVPTEVSAWSPFGNEPIIPCGFDSNHDGVITDGSPIPGQIGPTLSEQCNFDHFVKLIANVIDALLYFATLIAAIVFTVAGFKLITAGGSPGQIQDARRMFTMVLIGYAIALSAWLIVNTIESALLKECSLSFIRPSC